MNNRHKKILEILEKEKEVKVQHLSKMLNISAVTIRKDLKLLEAKRLLFRNHGSASLESPYVNDRPLDEKEFINAKEKACIGKKAAELIDNEQYIILASGTTILALAREINPRKKLTVVTSSLNAAVELVKKQNVEVLQLGGYVRASSFSVIGYYSELILNEIACSKLFISVDAIDIDYGLTTSNALEAHLNKIMIKSAKEVILLADSSKFGKKSFGRICGIEDVNHIITDKNLPAELIEKIENLGILLTYC